MRARPYLMCLWPGLASLWSQGCWRGLASAAVFGLILNFALIVTFVWPELFSSGLPRWLVPAAAWVLVLCLWVAGFCAAARKVAPAQAIDPLAAAEAEKLFREAQAEYMKGHWLEAETLLDRVLIRRSNDVEAQLLQATILRRTARLDGARELLNALSENDAAPRWRHEIAGELKRIENLEQQSHTNKITLPIPALNMRAA